jgi:transposase-like protein
MSKVEVLNDKARKTYNQEEKDRILEDWKQSGQGITSFCKSVGIPYSTINKWIKEKEAFTNTKETKNVPSVTEPASPFNLPQIHNERIQQLTNENLILTQQNQWLRTQVEQYQRTLGKLVFESGRIGFESDMKKAG